MFPEISTIKMRRKRIGVSQSRLAKSVGISQSLLTKIENGKAMPSYSKAVDIFERLDELEHRDEKKAKDVMRREVITLQEADTAEKAAAIAKAKGISQFPVLKSGRIIGSIRTIDIAGLEKSHKVGWSVSPPFPTVGEDTPISLIKELLKRDGAVVVVRGADIVGIVSPEDLL